MAAGGRFGGHIVSGHVDGVGRVQSVRRDDNAVWYTVEAAPSLLRYVVEKGSITMDGVSLTVARVEADRFSVSLIPHTAAVTVLGRKRPGDVVNIPPEVKHWHGAAADSWFSHLALEVPGEDCSNEWLEAVSDAEYGNLT